jgi:hypothetical protein
MRFSPDPPIPVDPGLGLAPVIRISIPAASLGIVSRFAICALVCAAVVLGACGGEGDGPGPDTAVRDYYAALLAGDGARACSLLTDGLERDISASRGASAAGGECRDVLALAIGLNPDREGDDLASLRVDVSTDGDRASARLANPLTGKRETLRVERVDGKWRIASLELRPQR